MTARTAGFSLLEVVIATAIMLVMVSSASALEGAVRQSEGHALGSAAAHEVLRTWIVQVRSLPFAPPPGGARPAPAASRAPAAGGLRPVASWPCAGEGQPPEAGSVVGLLFPHADRRRNTAEAEFEPADAGATVAGRFMTLFHRDGGVVQASAWFVTSGDSGWQPLSPDALAGWSAGDMPPPSGALTVDAVYRSPSGTVAHVTALFTPPLADERSDAP
jgi:prepilin-type N-terminal cleavage/methylation domain-containing protein